MFADLFPFYDDYFDWRFKAHKYTRLCLSCSTGIFPVLAAKGAKEVCNSCQMTVTVASHDPEQVGSESVLACLTGSGYYCSTPREIPCKYSGVSHSQAALCWGYLIWATQQIRRWVIPHIWGQAGRQLVARRSEQARPECFPTASMDECQDIFRQTTINSAI